MAALDTVQDYIDAARVLLQDTTNAPYRNPDADFIRALNFALTEARKLRPDLFLGRATAVPFLTAVGNSVVFDTQYRTALLYYVVGHISLKDNEETQDARASAFLNKFLGQLMTLGA